MVQSVVWLGLPRTPTFHCGTNSSCFRPFTACICVHQASQYIWRGLQVVDSTADSIRRAQSALDSAASSAGRSAGTLGASRGQPAPFASTPLTSLPSFTADKEDVSLSGL